MDFLTKAKPKQTIIFCNSRSSAEKLYNHLKETKRRSTDIIHGGLEQSKRTSLFNHFRKMDITTLIATDLASRGLDFAHATHVINYDFPKYAEAYMHRTGRTARMGRKGVALTLFTTSDLRVLKTIINTNNIKPIWVGRAPDLSNNTQTQKRKNYNRPRQKTKRTTAS